MQIFMFFVHHCPFLPLFRFFLYMVTIVNSLNEKGFSKFGFEHFFVFFKYSFKVCDTNLLKNLVDFFIFALCLLLIFVVVCQIFGDESLSGQL